MCRHNPLNPLPESVDSFARTVFCDILQSEMIQNKLK